MSTALENAQTQAAYAVYFEFRKMLAYNKLTSEQKSELEQKIADIELCNPEFKRAYEMA